MEKIKFLELKSTFDIHSCNEDSILAFLNTISENTKSINHLGTFSDEIKITRDTGIKTLLNTVLVVRSEYKSETAGVHFKKLNGKRDIFELNYDLPDIVDEETEEKQFVVLSTVETHECSTTEKCSKCYGSGICSSCEGRGYNRCTRCDGTGKEEIRDGEYANGKPKYKEIGCTSCHGSGRKQCTSCVGTCRCSKCDGSGEVVCSRCEGTGFYQSFIAYSNKYMSYNQSIDYSDFDELKDIIPFAKGIIVYDDDLIEWSNKTNLVLDNRECAKKTNKHAPEIINNLEEIIITDETTTKIGRVSAKIESIPITIVDYKFEREEYQIAIIGTNNMICYYSIPTKHTYKQSFIGRILKSFNKTKRQIAFAYIASYMINADDNITQDEIKLLETFINHIKLKQEKKIALLNDISRKLTIEDFSSKIACIKKDKRALVFAWHCAIQDKQINQSEVDAFNVLANFFKVNQNEIELIKNKASKFATLKDSEMLEEYFK